jgi:ABC-type molybdate transport system ATPase subunit
MKMVTGFLAPTSGKVFVCGHDVANEPLAVKDKIGYLPEGAPAYGDMTPESYLNFIADVRRLSKETRQTRMKEAVERVQIGSVLRQPIDTLSTGFKRRVGLARILTLRPRIRARLAGRIASTEGRDDYTRVRLENEGGDLPIAHAIRGKSVALSTIARADGVVRVPASGSGFAAGAEVEVLLLD